MAAPTSRADRWAKVAAALAAGQSVTGAARAAGLSRESVSRRRQRDRAFRAEVERLRQAGPSGGLAAKAREVLDRALSGGAPPATAARVAQAVLAAGPGGLGEVAATPAAPPPLDAATALAKVGAAVATVAGAIKRASLKPPPEALDAFRKVCASAAALDLAQPTAPDLGAPMHSPAQPTAEPPAEEPVSPSGRRLRVVPVGAGRDVTGFTTIEVP